MACPGVNVRVYVDSLFKFKLTEACRGNDVPRGSMEACPGVDVAGVGESGALPRMG